MPTEGAKDHWDLAPFCLDDFKYVKYAQIKDIFIYIASLQHGI